eukprot:5066657-Pleurochrysis_carterae.AAC.1
MEYFPPCSRQLIEGMQRLKTNGFYDLRPAKCSQSTTGFAEFHDVHKDAAAIDCVYLLLWCITAAPAIMQRKSQHFTESSIDSTCTALIQLVEKEKYQTNASTVANMSAMLLKQTAQPMAHTS